MKVKKAIKKCGIVYKETTYSEGYHSNYSMSRFYHIEKNEDGKNEYYSKRDGSLRLMGRQGVADIEQKEINRKKVIHRAKNTLIEIINTNATAWIEKDKQIYPKFLTLTFKREIEDLQEANIEFKNFIKRLNNYVITKKDINFIGVQYVAVPEIQEEREEKYGFAVWHYHILLFNLPYIDQKILIEIWNRGGVYIEGIKGKRKINFDSEKYDFKTDEDIIKNIGSYITKKLNYMTKTYNADEDVLEKNKSYLMSRKLYKPKVYIDSKNKNEIKELESRLSRVEPYYVKESVNEYLGVVTYREYILKD